MHISWNDITVDQFQQVYRLSLDTKLDDMDKVTNIIGILFNKSEKEIDELPIAEFGKLARECTFLQTDTIPGKAVKSIRIGLKRYAIPYKPSELTYRQYVEILSFSDKLIENLHNILASLVQPVRFGFKQKNKAKDHPEISQDMKQAKIADVYHSCLFFCNNFARSIEAIRGSLVLEMISRGMDRSRAEILLNDSISAMGGSTLPGRLQILKA